MFVELIIVGVALLIVVVLSIIPACRTTCVIAKWLLALLTFSHLTGAACITWLLTDSYSMVFSSWERPFLVASGVLFIVILIGCLLEVLSIGSLRWRRLVMWVCLTMLAPTAILLQLPGIITPPLLLLVILGPPYLLMGYLWWVELSICRVIEKAKA